MNRLVRTHTFPGSMSYKLAAYLRKRAVLYDKEGLGLR